MNENNTARNKASVSQLLKDDTEWMSQAPVVKRSEK